jgi:serine/threonine-protein kinase
VAASGLIGGRFEIEALAGTGGMGEVYRARDRRTGARIALKLLIRSTAVVQERFQRESQILSSLHHPNIVRWVAQGLTEDGRSYLAMEWLEGEDLGARILREPLRPSEAVAMALGAAAALGAAHERGILHRDVKPRNLFLVRREPAEVRVLDFGLARFLDGTAALTRTGMVVGSPGYMSPEQVKGAPVDVRTDVFSLGIVLYEALTGVAPFSLPDHGARGGAATAAPANAAPGADLVAAVMAQVLFEVPPPVRDLRPEVPEPLERLTMGMLAKDPRHRLESMARVVSLLQAAAPVRASSLGSSGAPSRASLAIASADTEPRQVRESLFGKDPLGFAGMQSHTTLAQEGATHVVSPDAKAPKTIAARSTEVGARPSISSRTPAALSDVPRSSVLLVRSGNGGAGSINGQDLESIRQRLFAELPEFTIGLEQLVDGSVVAVVGAERADQDASEAAERCARAIGEALPGAEVGTATVADGGIGGAVHAASTKMVISNSGSGLTPPPSGGLRAGSGSGSGSGLASPRSARTLKAGDVVLGKYRLERLLGSSGRGRVFVATQLGLERRVVLKLLGRDFGMDDRAAERFLRAARATLQLRSPHVVQVLDAGQIESGAPYVVTELLEGRDLASVLRDGGRIAEEHAVAWIREAAQGLADVHAAGIVHRDLKPSNLFLAIERGKSAIKILDFGLAKIRGEAEEDNAETRSGVLIGSRRYIAPEQISSSRTVDARADVWALGAILYELLAGRPPFAQESLPELIHAIRAEPPAALASFRPGLPVPLVGLIEECLEKDPSRRPGDARALQLRLAGLAGPSIGASTPVVVQAGKSFKRFAMVAAGLALLVLGAAVVFLHDEGAERPLVISNNSLGGPKPVAVAAPASPPPAATDAPPATGASSAPTAPAAEEPHRERTHGASPRSRPPREIHESREPKEPHEEPSAAHSRDAPPPRQRPSRSLDSLDQEVDRALKDRGLLAADLGLLDPLRASAWQAVRRDPAAAAEGAVEAEQGRLIGAIRAAPIPESLLKTKLDRVLAALRAVPKESQDERFQRLENDYFALRDRLHRTRTSQETEALARDITALERTRL